MAEIVTQVLIIGTSPAGLTAAALLSRDGISTMIVNRARWLTKTPRTHILDQRSMEVLRDLGREVEQEATLFATPQDMMATTVFCDTVAGTEFGRVASWSASKKSGGGQSATKLADVPQTYLEPILFKTACANGTLARMAVDYLSHVETSDGVTTTCLDRMTGEEFVVRSKYLIGADGSGSRVAQNAGFQFVSTDLGQGEVNLHVRLNSDRDMTGRLCGMYFTSGPGHAVGAIGMGQLRMVRPWTDWMISWAYDLAVKPPKLDAELAKQVAREMIGDDQLEVALFSAYARPVPAAYATRLHTDRVFIIGHAAHRPPPMSLQGSNPGIQDAFNLAWKLAHAVRGVAGQRLLDSYGAERGPVAKATVEQAQKSWAALQGNAISTVAASPVTPPPNGALHSVLLAAELAFVEPYPVGADSVAIGRRLPFFWLTRREGGKLASLDLCGQGAFTLLVNGDGDPWQAAAQSAGITCGIKINLHGIGEGQAWQDIFRVFASRRGADNIAAILVRPDYHVCHIVMNVPADPGADLTNALASVLAV